MLKLKPHLSVEQIAKKHRMDASFVQKQLDMGIPIEHEHTKDRELAMDIALQHLDEIPDYYTRLKKMEASAKKQHKKFKDVTEEGLRDWFGKSRSKEGKPGWVNVVTGGTCASDEPGEGVPKCVSSSKRASMSKTERLSASRRKKKADPTQQQKSGATKPTYVPTDKMKEEIDLQEVKDKSSKGSGKKDACYNKVKSRYSVWPSAYASGALVKCRKVGAANWGTKSEETMHEEERYCPLCDKRETRSECSYGEKAWDKVSVKDHEYSMVRSELDTLMKAAQRIKKKVGKGEGSLEAWVQSKITKAADYIDSAADYIDSGEMSEAKMLGFEIKKSSGAGALTPDAAKQLGPKAIELQKKKAAAVDLPKVKEETLVDKIAGEVVIEKCWTGYKRKKSTTEFAKGSCVKAENVTIEDANGNTFAEVIDLIKPDPIKTTTKIEESVRLQSETGNIIAVILSWRGKTYSIRMFFPQVGMPSKKDVTSEIQKVYPGAIVLQYNVSGIQAGMPLIQVVNSRSKNYLLNNKTIGEEVSEEVAAWQRKEGKNPEGGLNKKGIASYRRENPGSKLSMAVTTPPSKLKPGSKSAKRRKSFCARMGGMPGPMKDEKDRPTRKALSLRKWNC